MSGPGWIRPGAGSRREVEVGDEGEWWADFFPDLFGPIQAALVNPERTVREVDLVERLLPLEPGSRVLDVPCGEGRMALELARRGHRVVGLDRSAAMLSQARSRPAGGGPPVEWVEGDMRDLPWVDRFQAVVCYWGSFGYFDEEGDQAFVRAAAASLAPGGKLLLETHSLETLLPRFQPRGFTRLADGWLLEERSLDLARSRIEADWTLIRAGATVTRHSSIRLYSYRELATLLEACGLAEPRGHDGITGEGFRVGSTRLIMVATRPG